jgi:hypothetical protein
MTDFAAKLAIIAMQMLLKVMTETFIAKVTIATLGTWAKSTDNALDDKVVAAMAEALGVPVEKLKE